MEIIFKNDKVYVTRFGKTKYCDNYNQTYYALKEAYENNDSKLISHIIFNSWYNDSDFKPVEQQECIRATSTTGFSTDEPTSNIYWDDSAQEELDDLLGSDPYTPLY